MRSLTTALTLAFMFVTAAAHAQEAAPIAPASPPIVVLQPAPPPWASVAAAKQLERRGHAKKVAGAVLIGVGSAAVVTGVVLNALACNTRNCDNFRGPIYAPGLALGLVGGAAILAGIPTYVVGGVEVARGRRLEMTGFGAAPTLGANGVSGGVASASFRF